MLPGRKKKSKQHDVPAPADVVPHSELPTSGAAADTAALLSKIQFLESQVKFLTAHVSSFTSNMTISAAHQLNIFDHISSIHGQQPPPAALTSDSAAPVDEKPSKSKKVKLSPEGSHDQHRHSLRTSSTPFRFPQVIKSGRSEMNLQRLVADSAVSALQDQVMRQRQDTAHDATSKQQRSRRAFSEPPKSDGFEEFQVVSVKNIVREYELDCLTCKQAETPTHKFHVCGTCGDLHVSLSSAAAENGGNDGQCARADSDSLQPPLFPRGVSLIVEFKSSSALSEESLSQALLQLHLHRQLHCCTGKEWRSSITAPTNQSTELVNCMCTTHPVAVMILWGTASGVVSSIDYETGQRDKQAEQRCVEWAAFTHELAAKKAAVELATLAAKAEEEKCSDVTGEFARGNNFPVTWVAPPPKYTEYFVLPHGAVMGSVTWRTLAPRPDSLVDVPMVPRGDLSLRNHVVVGTQMTAPHGAGGRRIQRHRLDDHTAMQTSKRHFASITHLSPSRFLRLLL